MTRLRSTALSQFSARTLWDYLLEQAADLLGRMRRLEELFDGLDERRQFAVGNGP